MMQRFLRENIVLGAERRDQYMKRISTEEKNRDKQLRMEQNQGNKFRR